MIHDTIYPLNYLSNQSKHLSKFQFMDLVIFVHIQLIEFPVQDNFVGWHNFRWMCSAIFTIKTLEQIACEETLIVSSTYSIAIPWAARTAYMTWWRSSNIHFTNFRANWFATSCCCIRYWFALSIWTPTSSSAHTLNGCISTIRTASWHKFFMGWWSMRYRICTSFKTLCVQIIC